MANNEITDTNLTDEKLTTEKEPATKHDVTEGGVLGAVGGAVVGGLAGGPIGAIIGAVVGGVASAGAVDVVDKHDHDYARTKSATRTDAIDDDIDDDATVDDHTRDLTATDTAPYAATTATPYAATAMPQDTVPQDTVPQDTVPQNRLTDTREIDSEITVPIIEEQLEVGKRQVQSGAARIHTDVIETPVEETVNLREEHVTLDRRTVDRPVTDADMAFKEKSFDVTETAEVPVVSKAAHVVEEVVIGKTATDRTETIHDTVRRTDVDVEELDEKPIR